jgi:hypothetical protein
LRDKADPAETRSKYFEDSASVVDRHREQEAIAYSTSALKVLSYLNGGGLLAMLTAVALFHASIDKVGDLLACYCFGFHSSHSMRGASSAHLRSCRDLKFDDAAAAG